MNIPKVHQMTENREPYVMIRVPRPLALWADSLVDRLLTGNPELWHAGIKSRAAILRMAIHRGLTQLEDEYGPSQGNLLEEETGS